MEWLLVLKWLVVLGVLTGIGAPIAAWLCPTLPRRGAAFALPVTILSMTVVIFLVGQVTFGLHTVVFGLLVTLGASGLAYRDGAVPEWRAVGRSFLVFGAGFLLLVFFRGSGPTITQFAGEQFLHFGLTKALTRAPALPPEDFWYAGEPLRYYYGTQLQVTSLSMLTATPMRFGFNLGIATFYGMLVVSAYGLAGAIASAAGRSYRLGGILGVFFTAVGGALTTAVRLTLGLLPEETAQEYGHAAFDFAASRSGRSYPEMVDAMSSIDSWGWWYTRYVVPGTLQEFPLYSFVKSDLHGHALSTGYIVVAAALAFSYYQLPPERRGRRLAVLFGGLGIIAGVFGFMNTWSLPTAVGLAWLAVASADAHPATLLPDSVGNRLTGPGGGDSLSRVGQELWRLVLAAVPAILVGIIGVVIASPFLVFGHVPENQGAGFFPPRTELPEFLIIYGGLMALFAGYVAYRGWPATRDTDWRVGVAVLIAGWGTVRALMLLSAPVIAVTAPLLLAAWWLVRTDRVGFETVLLVAGVGLILSLELVFAKVAPWPEGPARWNTSLKVAVQGWTLAGVAAGGVAALLLGDAWAALRGRLDRTSEQRAATTDGGETTGHSRLTAVLVGLLAVAVILASSPFPFLAGAVEMGPVLADDSEFTLDGLGRQEANRPNQMAAIQWLDDRSGRPVIVEAPGRPYEWTSPAATMTGLPGLLGWTHHQKNYRPDEKVDQRIRNIEAIYTGTWRDAARMLSYYDVAYIYVGPVERDRYGENLRSFADRQGLSVAFENDAVTIYEVNHERLSTNASG